MHLSQNFVPCAGHWLHEVREQCREKSGTAMIIKGFMELLKEMQVQNFSNVR